MENNQQNETFQYSYSASQQEEIKSIRQKYQPKELSAEEDKMEKLRRLDASVTKKGSIVSLAVGIIGSLILGTGMACVMEIGSNWFVPGVIIGIVGLAGIAAAYPLYVHITKKERERVAPEIIKLADELLK